jgi:hypothetical protein
LIPLENNFCKTVSRLHFGKIKIASDYNLKRFCDDLS